MEPTRPAHAAAPMIVAVVLTATVMAAVIATRVVSVPVDSALSVAAFAGGLAVVLGAALAWPVEQREAAPRAARPPVLAVSALALAVVAGGATAAAVASTGDATAAAPASGVAQVIAMASEDAPAGD